MLTRRQAHLLSLTGDNTESNNAQPRFLSLNFGNKSNNNNNNNAISHKQSAVALACIEELIQKNSVQNNNKISFKDAVSHYLSDKRVRKEDTIVIDDYNNNNTNANKNTNRANAVLWRSIIKEITSNSILRLNNNNNKKKSQTMLQYKQERIQTLETLKNKINQEIYEKMHMALHEKRLKLLFHHHHDQSSEKEDREEDEAYLSSLDPANSERDAFLHDTITYVDENLKTHFPSIFHTRVKKENEDSEEEVIKKQIASRLQQQIITACHHVPCFPSNNNNNHHNKIQLLEHQQEGVQWLLQRIVVERASGILGDDMGLGKTAQVIVFITVLKLLLEETLWQYLFPSSSFVKMEDEETNLKRHIFDKVYREFEIECDHFVEKQSRRKGKLPNDENESRRKIHQHVLEAEKRKEKLDAFTFDHIRAQKPEMRYKMRPILVVAPLSTLPHWKDEFSHFQLEHYFHIFVLNGTRQEREAETSKFLALLKNENNNDPKTLVLIIPHDLLLFSSTKNKKERLSGSASGLSNNTNRILGSIPKQCFQLVIVDEAQRIKNNKSSLFSKLSDVQTFASVALTGTPLQNNVLELFSLLQFVAPRVFFSSDNNNDSGPSDIFVQLQEILVEAGVSSDIRDKELYVYLCKKLHRLLAPFVLRRDKKTVLNRKTSSNRKSVFPVKKEFIINVPLMPFQKSELEKIEAKHKKGCLTGNRNIHIRKILLHPFTRYSYFYINHSMINTSGRLLLLDFMMSFFFRCARELSKRKKTKHNHSNDDKDDEKNKHVHKFLIFSSWTLVLDVVESLCSYRRYPYVRLDGNTAVSTRQENIQKFNGAQSNNKNKNNENENNEEEEPPLCFLISKGAGGVGLNLQSADTVFLLDLEYNPARDSQALSRAYRVGQTREVRVFRFYVGEHETERKIKEEFYDKKIVLDEGVVQSGLYDLHSSQKEREAQLQRVLASSRNNNNNENENNKEEVKVPRGVKRSRLTFVDDENENNNNNNPQFCSPSSPTEREIDAFSPTTNPSITDNIHYPQNNNNKRRKTSELLLPSPPVTTTLKEEEELIFNSNSEWYRRLLHEVDTTPYLLALRSTWEAVLPRDEEERGLLNEMLEELEEGANHHH